MSTIGRTSTFSRALTHSIVTILLAGLLPSVGADCSVDRHGNGHCTLSVAAHAGLGVVLVLLLVAMAWYMRYRRWRATQIHISNALQNELNADNGLGRVYYLLETQNKNRRAVSLGILWDQEETTGVARWKRRRTERRKGKGLSLY
ncbi:hypothetical protein H4582DRAFT_1116738 [Lactarius indigo]|nr:hypothetical protein H4582DRAFT_1116738 [Lactarius indigo]